MTIYRLADHLHGVFDTSQVWFIERAVLDHVQCRLRFEGTRRQAEAEVARLNALTKATLHDPWEAA